MQESRNRTLGVRVILRALLAVTVYVIWRYDSIEWIERIFRVKAHPVVFLLLISILPAGGFPIRIFPILAGIEFGILEAILITTAVIRPHMLISLYRVNSVLRPYVKAFLQRRDYTLPRIPEKRTALALCFLWGFLEFLMEPKTI